MAAADAVLAVKCIRVSSTSTLARLAGGGREDGDIGGSGPSPSRVIVLRRGRFFRGVCVGLTATRLPALCLAEAGSGPAGRRAVTVFVTGLRGPARRDAGLTAPVRRTPGLRGPREGCTGPGGATTLRVDLRGLEGGVDASARGSETSTSFSLPLLSSPSISSSHTPPKGCFDASGSRTRLRDNGRGSLSFEPAFGRLLLRDSCALAALKVFACLWDGFAARVVTLRFFLPPASCFCATRARVEGGDGGLGGAGAGRTGSLSMMAAGALFLLR